jgi:hypothetical protein
LLEKSAIVCNASFSTTEFNSECLCFHEVPEGHFERTILKLPCRPKNFSRHLMSFQKKNCNPYFIVVMTTVLIMICIFLGVKFQNSKLFYYFLLHRTFTCTIALIVFIYVGFLEYMSIKQFYFLVTRYCFFSS